MEYQLVIQFRPLAAIDFDTVAAIENAIRERLGDSGVVDGRDIGSGEFNVFILTDNPMGSFQRVQRLLQDVKLDGAMNVAFRDVNEEEYKILWPPTLTKFEIV
jgi:hypothetical protein